MIAVPIWIIPSLVSIIIVLWINFGFYYDGDYNFTGVFTLPLWAFLTSLTWMLYFAVMYWMKP